LLIGSEGTLGVITAAWLRLIPAPTAGIPVAAGYPSIEEGVEAVYAVMASDVVPSAIEYFQGTCLRHAPPPFFDASQTQFLVLCDAESETERDALLEALGPEAATYDPAVVWRWREGVSGAVRGARGEKLSEDIAVPLDQIQAAIEGTLEIGADHGLEACSWGHAGDGNLHSTFLFDPHDPGAVRRAHDAAERLFELARELGGTVSGEHGLGLLKRGQLVGQWSDAAIGAHDAIKAALDPEGLFNPGKKLARVS
jgi:FAD/FMN-containing dehydrogenase